MRDSYVAQVPKMGRQLEVEQVHETYFHVVVHLEVSLMEVGRVEGNYSLVVSSLLVQVPEVVAHVGPSYRVVHLVLLDPSAEDHFDKTDRYYASLAFFALDHPELVAYSAVAFVLGRHNQVVDDLVGPFLLVAFVVVEVHPCVQEEVPFLLGLHAFHLDQASSF